jgi:Chlamydia-phage Chp2 scaffold (Chlamy_scaf).
MTDIDYQTSLDTIMTAQAAFNDLPSKLRKRFDNDPSQLLSFLQNPQNRDEAIELGFIDPPPADVSKNQPGDITTAQNQPGGTTAAPQGDDGESSGT